MHLLAEELLSSPCNQIQMNRKDSWLHASISERFLERSISFSHSYPEVIGRFFIMLHGSLKICNVTLVHFSNCLMVLCGDGETAHIRINIDGFGQTIDGLCNEKKKFNVNSWIHFSTECILKWMQHTLKKNQSYTLYQPRNCIKAKRNSFSRHSRFPSKSAKKCLLFGFLIETLYILVYLVLSCPTLIKKPSFLSKVSFLFER